MVEPGWVNGDDVALGFVEACPECGEVAYHFDECDECGYSEYVYDPFDYTDDPE